MSSRIRAVLLLFVVLAAAEFAVRGPVRWVLRGNSRANDLTGPYVGTRAWARGLDPYRSDVYWKVAEDSGLIVNDRDPADRPVDDFQANTPYPPTTFVVLSPLAPFGWSAARILAVIAAVSLVFGAVAALLPLCGPADSTRRYALVAMALGLAPLQTAVGAGNPTAAAASLVIMAVSAGIVTGADGLAGLLLGLAICVKPPVAAPILAYYVVRGRSKIWSTAAVIVVIVAAIGVLRFSIAGVPWIEGYLKSNRLLLTNHGADIIIENDLGSQFTNLQFPGNALFHDPQTANRFALLTGAALGAVWLLLVWKRRDRPDALLELSAIAVISLLPVYHRIYDASLLLLPLGWLFAPGEGPPSANRAAAWTRRVTLVILIAFLVPSATLLEMARTAGVVPPALASAWLWRVIVAPHQVWLLLALAVTLLAAMQSESVR